MYEAITAFQAATLAIAAIGAVLGVINTWHNLDKSKVKLKVLPAHAIPVGNVNQDISISIEVTNLSSFAVTISDIGFFLHGTSGRATIVRPIFSDGKGSFPKKLEPRSSITVYSVTPVYDQGYRIKKAYARTQCGITKTGNSPALKQISREQYSS